MLDDPHLACHHFAPVGQHLPPSWQSVSVVAQFEWREFEPGALARAKAYRGLRTSVCIPARNEEATVGDIVAVVHDELMERHGLVDELVVIDDGSSDATAKEAEGAGAEVIRLPEGLGKGQAMRRGLQATTGEIVSFCDADVYGFSPRFVVGLFGPLLTVPSIALVKAAYRRPLEGAEGEGGRVTELVAKPLIRLLFPDLAALQQPLAGEWAARREVLEQLDLAAGYGVELGALIDVRSLLGVQGIAQCDMGERRHRNRPLAELAPMAETIMRLALERAGLLPPG